MDKNTLLGILAIGAILLGFSFYNSKQNEKFQAEKHRQDSIAAVKIASERAFQPAAENPTTTTLTVAA
ncbi:MAG: membrane protein insertase YidC, partial [Prevotellaceae bacterium]|nr:membrane protein insertase YidC [Prevotellaceae bacterium]